METKVHLTDLHTEKQAWLSTLALAKDEIETFEKRLGEIVVANSIKDTTALVEHFQNQCIRQREVMDILKHDIQASERILVKQIESNPVATDHKTGPDHSALREEMETFERLFKELKVDLNKFAAKTL